MRDIKLYYIEETGFDINIIDGEPEYVDYANQTQDQRAAIGAAIEKGSIPGNESFGADWAAVFDKESSLLDLANEVQENVNNVAGGDGQMSGMYMSMLVPKSDGSVTTTVMKGEV